MLNRLKLLQHPPKMVSHKYTQTYIVSQLYHQASLWRHSEQPLTSNLLSDNERATLAYLSAHTFSHVCQPAWVDDAASSLGDALVGVARCKVTL